MFRLQLKANSDQCGLACAVTMTLYPMLPLEWIFAISIMSKSTAESMASDRIRQSYAERSKGLQAGAAPRLSRSVGLLIVTCERDLANQGIDANRETQNEALAMLPVHPARSPHASGPTVACECLRPLSFWALDRGASPPRETPHGCCHLLRRQIGTARKHSDPKNS